MPKSAPDQGCYVSGLMLHHASWDSATSTLCEFDTAATQSSKTTYLSEPSPEKMPVIWLKPIQVTELDTIRKNQKAQLYACPIYGSTQSGSVGSFAVMATVELPTVEHSPGYWARQRVYLTAELLDEDQC